MHANHLESRRRRAHSIYQGLEVVKIKDLHKTSAHDVVKQRAQTSPYSKAYLKEMLDVLGLINKAYLENDIGDLIGASRSHHLER